jgi:signal peptidase I
MNLDRTNTVKCSLTSEALRSFGTLRFPATGWSMLPTVWSGETLVVERVHPAQVRVGDVVLVAHEVKLTAHRIVAVPDGSRHSHWITQGDALPIADAPVRDEELLGRVAYLIRGGKCIPVPTELSVIHRLLAGVLRRSPFAARALVFLHNKIQVSNQSTLPCQS